MQDACQDKQQGLRPSPGVGRRRGAFTLIELLVVVAIIALLISILLPALGRARQQGKEAVCRSNLHQLVLATTYYADENQYRLPWIRGTGPTSTYPYYQYHQIFLFWPYLKDLRHFKCPSARDKNSTKVEDISTAWNQSFYVVQKADKYMSIADQNQWWPWYRKADYAGKDKIDALWTEYWFNDWGANATDPTTGQRIPSISGGVINKIPRANYAVVISDGCYDAYELRHMGASEFAFLDGHVERLARSRYLAKCSEVAVRKDHDPWMNAPFWCWGLTLTGIDGGCADVKPP